MNTNFLKQFFILIGVMLFSSLKLTAQKTNFSGIWGINISKSDFGEFPPNVTVNQYDINQKDDTIFIKRLTLSPDGRSVISNEKISFNGKPCISVMPKGKITSAITWSPDKQIMNINSSYSTLENPTEIAFKISQSWSLSKDGNDLVIKMVTPAYSFRAVYSKAKKGAIVAKDSEPFFDPRVITIPKIIFYSVIPGILIMYGSFLLFTRKKK